MRFEDAIAKFEKIGARAVFPKPSRWMRSADPVRWPRLDIRRDKKGEYFSVGVPDDCSVRVIDTRPDERHLLLLAETADGEKAKFLCGHDERHWFVSAVPGDDVRDVRTAQLALQPVEIHAVIRKKKVKSRFITRRKNKAYIRQGEWFFVAREWKVVPEDQVLKDEPLNRGRGSSHFAEYLHRTGGTPVKVHPMHARTGISEVEYQALDEHKKRAVGWQNMVRDAKVYVRGRITHSQHRTVTLTGWHRVYLNTEGLSVAAQAVAFLD